MDAKDLIIGEIYISLFNSRGYIFKYNGSKSNVQHLGKFNKMYSTSGYDFYNGFPIENATQEEKAWLEACIAANKFIPRKEVKFNLFYEIY